LYDVACDAELHEKSKADLIRVTNLVIDRCRQTVANYESQAGSFHYSCIVFIILFSIID